ncbi:hypothetical protein C8Q80DRAFT_1099604 [Daedaleopsis nitida]|nr:hypothetical protein C8Q80DRAFT_1099604 [Daedaleopsis nitida]
MADFVPTAPGPGDTFAADSDCTIQWQADATGKWTNVSIFLMTGPNNNMSRLMQVTSSLDGTDEALSPFTWTCPRVQPYSAIYFYQFTNGDDLQGSQWTTRFTIASPNGESDSPENDIQPNGDKIAWGNGRLKSKSRISSHHESSDGPPARSQHSSSDKEADVDALESGASSKDVDASDFSNPSSAVTRIRKHSKTAAVSPSDIVSDSMSTPSPHSIPSRSSLHHPLGSGTISKDVTPSSFHTHIHPTSSSSSCVYGSTCSPTASSTADASGMQLASSSRVNRDDIWLRSVSVYSVLVAMLL